MKNSKEASVEIANNLKDVFRKCTLPVRRKAWRTIISEKGKREVEKLILNPNRNVSRFRSFREWLETDNQAS